MVKTLVSSLRKHKPQGTLTKSKFRTTPPSRQCSPTRDRDRREALPVVQRSRRQQGRLNRQRSTRVAPPARTRAASEACTRDLTSGTRVPVAPSPPAATSVMLWLQGSVSGSGTPVPWRTQGHTPGRKFTISRPDSKFQCLPTSAHAVKCHIFPWCVQSAEVIRNPPLPYCWPPRLAAAIHVFIWPLTRVMNKTKENLCFKIFSLK